MINLVEILPSGNAVRLFITPPKGAVAWRVLRRTVDSFTGPDDANAVLVCDGSPNVVSDITALVNGVTYFYAPFYRTSSGEWVRGQVVTAKPEANYAGDDFDVQKLVRDRIEAGLGVEVARKTLIPPEGKPRIQVVTAPFALVEGIAFPCVSVHQDTQKQAFRAIGDVILSDIELPGTEGWVEHQGTIDSFVLNIVGAALNPDGRAALRRALKRIIEANYDVFEDHGLLNIEVAMHDLEQEVVKNATLYLVVAQFQCLAPSFVASTVDEIRDVTVRASGLSPSDLGHADG